MDRVPDCQDILACDPELTQRGRSTETLIVHDDAMDGKGNLVTPVVAAKRLTELLVDTRKVSRGHGKKKDLLGELVSVNVELVGLRNRPVFLSWLIFQKDRQSHLFGKWLDDFVADRLVASTDDDTTTLTIWIPLPKVPGPYFLQLSLTTDGANLTSKDSGLFG